MRVFFCLALLLTVINLSQAQEAMIIDRHAVALFESIPDTFLTLAKNTRLLFSDRSVGQNINEALDYFQASSWAQTPASARRDYTDSLWHWKTFGASDLAAGTVPDRIYFEPDPIKYSRAKWHFELRSGDWSSLTKDFIDSLAPSYIDSTDVLSYQFSYLNVLEGDNIANPNTGFFSDNPSLWDIHDLENFIGNYPDKTFFFWTASLARGIGSKTAMDFNNAMRAYCQQEGKILLDMADILSHTDQGVPCYDNRDGVLYTSQTGQTENHPDDGFDYPAICQDYTTETDGGHLGSVSAGKVMIAKAFWVLMARIAGWDGKTNGFSSQQHMPEINIWPNPATRVIQIQSKGGAILSRLTLINALGQTSQVIPIDGQAGDTYALNRVNEPTGWYTLLVESDKGRMAYPIFFTND